MPLKYKIALIALAFILANALAVTGGWLGVWNWDFTLYFIWAECALLGGLTLIVYAKHLLVFFAVLLIAGAVLSLTDSTFWGDLRVPVTFWSLYSLCWLFYFEIGKSPFGHWIKRLHPFKHFMWYIVYMVLSAALSVSMTLTMYKGWDLVTVMPQNLYVLWGVMTAGIPTITIGALKIIDMIGARHFVHFLLGTYHRPVEKERIVMFFDMVGSSKIAEKLKPKESMALIARFIFDASATFRHYDGDILNYTGDGLVVTWHLFHADKALAAVDALEKRFEANRKFYTQKFGFVPDFRIGLHAGKIVISQIGEEKLFLGLYGDVVNTAARLEAMNKELGTKVLLSTTVRRRLSLPWQELLKPKGKQEVRGRQERIEVFTL